VTKTGAGEKDCPFCAIIRGEDDSARVLCEGDGWLSFFPLQPAAPGHCLVVPRLHVESLWKSTAALNSELMAAVEEVGSAIKLGLNPEGLNLISSEGAAAEQTVFHLHLHLVPRWTRDTFGPLWPDTEPLPEPQLSEAAKLIRGFCRRTQVT
jgi:histidine triad (HIT) family protein